MTFLFVSRLSSAFWMMQTDPRYMSFDVNSACQRSNRGLAGVCEVDIVETYNIAAQPHDEITAHFTNIGCVEAKHSIPVEEFRIYGLLWTEGNLKFYRNDKEIYHYIGKTPALPMMLILTLMYMPDAWSSWIAGGKWNDLPIVRKKDCTHFPVEFQIDWVKAWQFTDLQ
ncbi:MAG: hypothetical protein FWE67_14640 [Planctomycetaceae bacterium]|nr:hypothetical protein [Planctomycetaceae bacterium]